jgi:hypothetical protein
MTTTQAIDSTGDRSRTDIFRSFSSRRERTEQGLLAGVSANVVLRLVANAAYDERSFGFGRKLATPGKGEDVANIDAL